MRLRHVSLLINAGSRSKRIRFRAARRREADDHATRAGRGDDGLVASPRCERARTRGGRRGGRPRRPAPAIATSARVRDRAGVPVTSSASAPTQASPRKQTVSVSRSCAGVSAAAEQVQRASAARPWSSRSSARRPRSRRPAPPSPAVARPAREPPRGQRAERRRASPRPAAPPGRARAARRRRPARPAIAHAERSAAHSRHSGCGRRRSRRQREQVDLAAEHDQQADRLLGLERGEQRAARRSARNRSRSPTATPPRRPLPRPR